MERPRYVAEGVLAVHSLLSQAYMMIFPPLLNPMFWERPGNIPALTRLLVSYLSKAGQEIVAGGKHKQAGIAVAVARVGVGGAG